MALYTNVVYILKYMANIDFNFCRNGQWAKGRKDVKKTGTFKGGRGLSTVTGKGTGTNIQTERWKPSKHEFSFSSFSLLFSFILLLLLLWPQSALESQLGVAFRHPQWVTWWWLSSCPPAPLSVRWRTTDANADWPCVGPLHFVQPDKR